MGSPSFPWSLYILWANSVLKDFEALCFAPFIEPNILIHHNIINKLCCFSFFSFGIPTTNFLFRHQDFLVQYAPPAIFLAKFPCLSMKTFACNCILWQEFCALQLYFDTWMCQDVQQHLPTLRLRSSFWLYVKTECKILSLGIGKKCYAHISCMS